MDDATTRAQKRKALHRFFVSVQRENSNENGMVRLGDVDATKTTTHLRGDGRKVPGIRGVLRQNGLGAIIARRGDERVYERHDVVSRTKRKRKK